MMNGDWGAGGAWMILGGVMMIGFWALVFWAVVSLVRRSPDAPPPAAAPSARSAEEILAERFARGELDAEEFQQRRRALQSP